MSAGKRSLIFNVQQQVGFLNEVSNAMYIKDFLRNIKNPKFQVFKLIKHPVNAEKLYMGFVSTLNYSEGKSILLDKCSVK